MDEYAEFGRYMLLYSHNPYPMFVADRGQTDVSPFVAETIEVQFKPRDGRAPVRGSDVDMHRIEGPTLDPGRVLTHPGRIVAPVFR